MLLLGLLLGLGTTVSAQKLTIRYVGNMGVRLEFRNHTVLVDALHNYYGADYLFPPDDSVAVWMAAGDYTAACVTHPHGDHFDPRLSMDFLKYHNDGQLIAPEQVRDSIHPEGQVLYLKRRILLQRDRRKSETALETGDLRIATFAMPHINRQRHGHIQNMGYAIYHAELTGPVLHLGDCDADLRRFRQLGTEYPYLSFVIVPYWMGLSEEGRECLALLTGEHDGAPLIFTHFPPTGYTDAVERLQVHYPKASYFTELGAGLVLM